MSSPPLSSPDLHHGELPEHRLLIPKGGEGPAPHDPDRHLQLQQPQQQASAPGLLPDQGLLRQGEGLRSGPMEVKLLRTLKLNTNAKLWIVEPLQQHHPWKKA